MFSARTNQSGKLKALFEVLFSNTQDVVLTISKSGIESELSTVNDATISVRLPAEGFDAYEYTYDAPMYVGLGAHVNTFIKSLKNKTVVTLSITTPFTLCISLAGADDCTIDQSVAFICAQNICPSPAIEYDVENGFSVAASLFNSMCKSFSKTTAINVSLVDGQLMFAFELPGIASKVYTIGHKDPSRRASFYQQIKSDTFVRICKLASFCKTAIKICAEQDKPLMILAESGLGSVRVTMNTGDDA